ncbi:BlaI/MecI/CopY family transcriptional regulator [Xanthobacter variabilis]|uniref:BlaI/MecI/CopY family transcriptional regulator n=1 Tax=Xanthobacter variabilis TaxID=3119932 RepID=UPI00374EA3B0
MKSSYLARMQARISELEGIIKDAERELGDLRTAIRVLESFGSGDGDVMDVATRSGRGPTISDLISEVLTECGPLESREIFERVSARQETTANTVSTTLSRMKDQGVVALNGRSWGLINKSASAVDEMLSEPVPEEFSDLQKTPLG